MASDRRKALKVLGGLAIYTATSTIGRATPGYVFSAVPQFTPPQVFREWQPLLKRLNSMTGIALTIRTYESIPQFEEAFARGDVDFAYMNPYHAVMARAAQGYIPLVRDSEELKGILLSRRGEYRDLKSLDGKRIGFPAPNAFGASLYMRALLHESIGIRFESRWLQTHSNVYRHIIAGEVAAGGSVQRAFESEPQAVRNELAVIFETPGVAPHPIVAHPRVAAAVREKLANALLMLRGSEEGKGLLKTVRMPGLMGADYRRDYAPLERLKLGKYVGA